MTFFQVSQAQPNHLSFTSIPMSLLRTFSMMLGEMDFVGTFVQPFHTHNLPFPYTSFVILSNLINCNYVVLSFNIQL